MKNLSTLSLMLLVVLIGSQFIFYANASPELWSKTYGENREEYAHCVIESSDGGFIITGWKRPEGGGHSDLFILKTNQYGMVDWNKTCGGREEETGYSIVETPEGGFAVAGFTKSFGDIIADVWLIKTDDQGNMIWNKTYGEDGEQFAYSLIVTSDGGFALAGYIIPNDKLNFDFLLIKTDSKGNIEWKRAYGGATHEIAYSLVETSDGGFAIAGQISDSLGHRNFLVIKTDQHGNEEWSKTYGGDDETEAYSVVQTSDGGLAISGWKQFQRFITLISNFWLVKTDIYGNVEWNQTFEGGGTHIQHSLIETSDNGFAIVGGSSLIKTDIYGAIWSGMKHLRKHHYIHLFNLRMEDTLLQELVTVMTFF